jgi:DNA-binding CsgD family transcriptional regulator
MAVTARGLVDDGCESFDGDLDWILEKLAERASASVGLILRSVEGMEQPVLMARTTASCELSDVAFDRLLAGLRATLAADAALPSRQPALSDSMQLEGAAPERIRLLYMTFEPAPGVQIVAAVGRPESSFSLLQTMVARRLYPVLERYVRLWWMHRTERRRARAFEQAVELAELGILLLDRRGQVLHENAYARRVLDAGDGMRRVGKHVVPADPVDALRLQTAIQQALMINLSAERYAGWQAPLVPLRRGQSGRALIVTVMAHEGRAVDPDDPAVVVYVLHPECDLRQSLIPVCRIYGLTPAESRLVTELVKGSSLLEVSAAMNVSLPTLRAQLKHVFGKTRTNRQAELVRVMLASALRSTMSVDLSLMQ